MRTDTTRFWGLLALALLLVPSSALAQDVLTAAWRVDAGTTSWLGTNNTERGGAYNPATDNIYVVSRNYPTGREIIIVDPATGDSTGTLDVTDITGGTFPLNDVAVTEDGQIFGANLAIGANSKVYYWADENAAPVVVLDELLEGPRYGDGLGLEGTGTDVTVYLVGSGGNDRIAKLDWNAGTSMLELADYLIPEPGNDLARYGVAPVPGTTTAWINEPFSELTLIDTETGAVLQELGDDVVSTGNGTLAYFEGGTYDFVATGPNFAGFGEFSLVRLGEGEEMAEVVAVTDNFDANPNGNATGFVAFDPVRKHLITLATNNALVAYDLTSVTPPVRAELTAPLWTKEAGSVTWLGTGNTERGGAYNPATDNVYVVSRNYSTGREVVIVDAATGDSTGTLDLTGVTGGLFQLNEIAVTDDGQIFATNLTVDPVASPPKVYYWADENAAPVAVWDATLDGPRYGDGMGVEGTGTDVTVYLMGSGGNDRIAKLDWNDTTGLLELADYLVPEPGNDRARQGIAPVPGTTTAWINEPTSDLALISTATGEILAEVGDDVVSAGNGQVAYFQLGFGEYVAAGPDFTGFMDYTVADVTDPMNAMVVARTDSFDTNPNLNATGFVAFDPVRRNLIVLATNNTLASYPLIGMGNTPPTAAMIMSPEEGAAITIEGDDDTPFVATWTAAMDDDGDEITYTWQLSATDDFAETLVSADVGTNTEFATDFGTVDALLAGAGVDVGGTATLYHRVIASDGMEQTAGPAASVILTRGVVTMTIAEAREMEVGSVVTIEGTVTRAMGAFTRIQDGTAGITIRQTSGAFFDGVADGTIGAGTEVRVTGETSEFANLLQINGGDLASYEVLSQGNAVPQPQLVTLQEIAANGEEYESELIRVIDLTTPTTDETFAAGTTYEISDPTLDDGSVSLRTPNADDTMIDGTAVPTGAFYFTGVLGQFDFDDPAVGYQLLPVLESDVTEGEGLPLNTIAEARSLPLGSVVAIEGTVTRAMGAFTRIQDETAGITIRQTSGAFFDAVADGTIAPGTRIQVVGETSEFAGLLQINGGDLMSYEIVSQGNEVPAPQDVTLQEIAQNGEQYESELIRVMDLTTTATDETFEAATTYEIADPTLDDGSVALRTPNADDTMIDGTAVPTGEFTFTGVLGQFDFDDPAVGYQLLPVQEGDIEPESGVATETDVLPTEFALEGNYPNPFNPTTTLQMDLPQTADVTVQVYDLLGRQVMTLDATLAAGAKQRLQLDASRLASGVYLYHVTARMASETVTKSGQMTLLK